MYVLLTHQNPDLLDEICSVLEKHLGWSVIYGEQRIVWGDVKC